MALKAKRSHLYGFLRSALTDAGIADYQAQWERISQMQQSAAIVIAVLLFSFSTLFGVQVQESNGDQDDLIAFVYTIVYVSAIFLAIISSACLFVVLWPKEVKGLPDVRELYTEIRKNLETKVFYNFDPGIDEVQCRVNPTEFVAYSMTSKLNEAIQSLEGSINLNQKYYRYGLFVMALSVFFSILINLWHILLVPPRLEVSIWAIGVSVVIVSKVLLSLEFYFYRKEQQKVGA